MRGKKKMKNQCFHQAINRDLDETGKYWKIAMWGRLSENSDKLTRQNHK